ncbi:MAG: c-type cytochrome biogenesis protein CcsB [Mycobacteriales bacterium]
MPVDIGLEQLSDNLLFATVICYAIAMVGYAAEFAFGHRANIAGRALPRIAGGAVDSVPATLAPVSRSARRTPENWATGVGRAAVAITVLGWVLHDGSVVTRGLAAHRVPWGNMYEYSSVICLVAVSAYLWLLTREPVRYLGALVMAPVVLGLGLAGTVLKVRAGPLVPALDSYWIKIHTTAVMGASGIFMVAFAASLLYLARESAERRQLERDGVARESWLPSAASVDRVAYRMIAFGFPVWTFGVVAGAVWAEAAWGRYWGWDPKETWAFITWVVYAGYLHARSTAGWKGRKAAYIGIAGFVSLLITFYAVNLWITGLHSYAGV